MEFQKFITGEGMKKVFSFLLLGGILYLLRDMINLILLTFIFSFIFYNAQKFIFTNINKVVKIQRGFITVFLYILFLLLLSFGLYKYIPLLVKQLMNIVDQITNIDINNYQDKIDKRVLGLLNDINFGEYLKTGGNTLIQTIKGIGQFSVNIFLAFILSLFFILEKEEIIRFGKRVETSKISFLYKYYKEFGGNFLMTFGKVIEMQILISFINSVLSIIILKILGFPQVIGLGFMIFLLGLIPVAGVIISFIPLSIVAFKLGGLIEIVYVILMIVFLHALESYVLNPKLMSKKTKLPVFFNFIILIVSEHLMGIWGLLIGVPLFMFALHVIGIESNEPTNKIKEETIEVIDKIED